MLRNLLRRSAANRLILGTPEDGILAATILSQTATGDSGPGLLYDAANDPVKAGKRLRLEVTSAPGVGTLFINENGTVDFSGAPDGLYTIGYNEYAANVIYKADIATITVGSVDASAPGATLTSSSDLTPGAATGQRNPTAPGATLTATSDLTPGAATASGNATAPGATLTATSDLTPGAATAQRNATAPAATLTATSDLTPGQATGGSSGAATAPGATLTATSDLTPGAATGQRNATAPGATLTATSDLAPGIATGGSAGDAIAPAATLTATSDLAPGTAIGEQNSAPTDVYHLVASDVRLTTIVHEVKPGVRGYLPGEVAVLNMRCAGLDGVAADPGALVLKIRPPVGAVVSYAYGVAAEVVRDAAGRYHADLVLSAAGQWAYRWELSAPNAGAAEGVITVLKSRVI